MQRDRPARQRDAPDIEERSDFIDPDPHSVCNAFGSLQDRLNAFAASIGESLPRLPRRACERGRRLRGVRRQFPEDGARAKCHMVSGNRTKPHRGNQLTMFPLEISLASLCARPFGMKQPLRLEIVANDEAQRQHRL